MTNSTPVKMYGIVEAVGTQYNGSLKVNNEWFSNAKGFKNPAQKGDMVTLTLEAWENKGKNGVNITHVDVLAVPAKSAETKTVDQPKQAPEPNRPPPSVQRDFDAENRGKVRHGLTVALIPLVATQVISVDKLKEVVDSLVPYVMGK